MESGKLIFRSALGYAPLAKVARIQGTVWLEAIVCRDGTIQDLEARNGHPLLAKGAQKYVAIVREARQDTSPLQS